MAILLGSSTCPFSPPMPGKKLAASVGATFRDMPGAPSPTILWSRILPFLPGHPKHLPSSDLLPTPFAWQAHMEAVHADWKEYLNLLICEESHLKYMEDYHQVLSPRASLMEALRASSRSRAAFPSHPVPMLLMAYMGAPKLARPLSVFSGGQGWRI